ncbi:PTPDC1 [Acanthosepion pharaonis]|uniref:PTPDC1 n=1 Tax=Acanthosepion pharaonis TaxID=158019 RepID=A0A812D423_ACAPH|nr:PTPDC1 [Sepia pharaonis]
MNPDPDEVIHPGAEEIQWLTKKDLQGNEPYPHYSIFTEQARNFISLEKQCALFCGGRRCKYERADCWPDQMVINGLFSHWVTDNILAMSRPNTAAIKEFNIIQQFKDANIKTVINLQESGEHASCGPGLEASGFSYNPQDFMDKDIYVYNFSCPDFGASSNGMILDMVRVMQFALSQGKVAIHCHAGLGRTGLLICSYLVFTNRMSANDAIHYVREKRPRSIQTRRQMQCLKDFADYLQQLWIIFTFPEDVSCELTLQQYLSRQRKLLHGYEGRKLKYIPKIIYFVCERLLELAGRGNSLSSTFAKRPVDLKGAESDLNSLQLESKSSKNGNQEASSSADTFPNWWKQMTETEVTCLKAQEIAIALCNSTFNDDVTKRKNELKRQLNSCDDSWKSIATESDPFVLAALLWDWLNQLKEPVLRYTDMKGLLSYVNDPLSGLQTLEKSPYAILNYFSKVIGCLLPLPDRLITQVLEMLLSHLTYHYIITDHCAPLSRCNHWLDLQPSTPEELLNFFKALIRINHK